MQRRKVEQILLSSNLFDPEWYIETYGNPTMDRGKAAAHYLSQSGSLRHNPSFRFDASKYLADYPDVKSAGMDPLIHYLLHGEKEGRVYSPVDQSNIARRKYSNSAEGLSDSELLQESILFDGEWYQSQYLKEPDEQAAVDDYISVKDGSRNPSPLFDAARYVKDYRDVSEAKVNPLLHYLRHGRQEGRFFFPANQIRPCFADTKSQVTPDVRNYSLPANPLVSIIIANRDGGGHLGLLFPTLQAQTYRNIEIILVDDGSTDNSIGLAEKIGATIVVATAPGGHSVGFAEANNMGLKAARGQLILLQNNDTVLDPNCIERLVRQIQKKPNIGAVAPKIRFWSAFKRLKLTASHEFRIDMRDLHQQLEYKKVFVRKGSFSTNDSGMLQSAQERGNHEIIVDLPADSAEISMKITTVSSNVVSPSFEGSFATAEHRFSTSEGRNQLHISTRGVAEFFLINNAGSMEQNEFDPGDRGFAQIDDGQYDSVEEVPYFCGCSVLLRRDALGGQNLFPKPFTAYYEDSELSVRIRSRGFKIIYDGSSIVYHRHSASNVELSGFWRKHTFRNKFIFKYASSEKMRPMLRSMMYAELKSVLDQYSQRNDLSRDEAEFAEAGFDLYDFAMSQFAAIDANRFVQRNQTRIGIFNPYWSTKGGGEAHALYVGLALSEEAPVELISTTDFNLDEVCLYFGVDSSRFRKRVVNELTYDITCEYDVFVNSCYGNHTPSGAGRSLYLVSFPFPGGMSREFLKSYIFLANSHFTLSWMKRYWGEGSFIGTVLNPAVKEDFYLAKPVTEALGGKKKRILSVGRFTDDGHTKNQKEILQGFRLAIENGLLSGDDEWELLLVGSSNDDRYVKELREMSAGVPCRIVVDAPFTEVVSAFKEASIYVHASGFGRNVELEPELLEHFGMTVAQAVAGGAIPIVFDAAGPREIVTGLQVGKVYRTVNELAQALLDVAKMDQEDLVEEMMSVSAAAENFTMTALQRSLSSITDSLKGGFETVRPIL